MIDICAPLAALKKIDVEPSTEASILQANSLSVNKIGSMMLMVHSSIDSQADGLLMS